ncbi:DNA-binding transcriptional regulator, LysR family [Rhizobium tibeticum]|uniref:DNA-binding transcriptional regulator, LysR family n=1 Tax=Rhizobium tibeticum TaxID=501024 RepID=A0A1H8H1B4_9HYPH|nr:LysR family transcriptional regulator [Rhizobium tibeticum]SEH63697.1 HTH-type transcriptional regulator GltC [Rhizobium tibeticum]SEN49915.1 DNA-binding transcriptional regulator, LysR family [Rhizobium tibeticum]
MDISGSSIKLRHLRVFREVMRAGSERLAAQMLKVTQPAVSQNVQQLEALVGFALFVRENNRLVPTGQAWDLLRSTDAAFAGLDRLGKAIDMIRSDEAGVIGIAAPSVFCLQLMPRAVKKIREANPSRTIQVRTGSYKDVADHVTYGRSDIGISRLPLDDNLFDWVPLGTAVNVCLFPPAHRFSELPIITPEDLIGEALIDIEPQYSAHQMNVNALRYMGSEPDIVVQYDVHGHDAGFVAAGIGVSITNEIIAQEYRHLGLETRRFEPGATYHYVVLWQKSRQLGTGIQHAVERIVDAFAMPD